MEETSNLKDELQRVDERTQELKDSIELAEAINRLHDNEDFNKVITNGYLEKEAERLFEVLTTPMSFKKEQLDTVMGKLSAIRDFKEYIGYSIRLAAMANEELDELAAYRQEVTAKMAEDK